MPLPTTSLASPRSSTRIQSARHGCAGSASVKINIWFAEQLAALAKKLDAIPEPGGSGTMLDHTTIVWTNELGKGNSHSHDDIPFVMLGGGMGFQTGRALEFERVAHNRLWLSLAHAFGHRIEAFGSRDHSQGGPLALG